MARRKGVKGDTPRRTLLNTVLATSKCSYCELPAFVAQGSKRYCFDHFITVERSSSYVLD